MIIKLKYPGICHHCQKVLPAGVNAEYYPDNGHIYCYSHQFIKSKHSRDYQPVNYPVGSVQFKLGGVY